MTTDTTPASPRFKLQPPGLRKTLSDSTVVLMRNLMHIPRVPEKLSDVTIQPIMFVLLFGFVFGSAIPLGNGANYRAYLLPGVFVQTMAFVAITTAVGMANDMAKGLIDRFKSLPMARSAVITGRAGADLAQSTIGVVVMSLCGLLIGWSINNGLLNAIAAYALLLYFGLAMIMAGVYIGLIVRQSETAQVLGFVVILPLTFLSNTFVPTQGMSPALRTIAEWNPVSSQVSALRTLFGNPGTVTHNVAFPLQHPVYSSIIWSTGILLVSLLLAVRKYARAVSR